MCKILPQRLLNWQLIKKCIGNNIGQLSHTQADFSAVNYSRQGGEGGPMANRIISSSYQEYCEVYPETTVFRKRKKSIQFKKQTFFKKVIYSEELSSQN